MRWCLSTPGSAENLLPVTLSTSVIPVSPYTCCCSFKMYLEALIQRVWRCTWRLGLSEIGDVLGDREIEWTPRCTWWPWLSEFGDALGGRDRVNSEMHLEAVIECGVRYTWRPWSIKIEGVLGGGWSGGDWSEGGQSGGSQSGGSQSGGSESGGGRLGGMCDGSWDSIHWLTCNCQNWVQQGPLRADRLAGSGRQSIVGWCSTRCMQYSVYNVLSVNSWSWHGEIERDDLTSCS